MKTYKNLYNKICSFDNLVLAWKKARKGKTKMSYVIRFESRLTENILNLQEELVNETYFPLPMKTFILRDPKTRRISKSAFRDRVVHHALCNVIEPIFEARFIHDSCANRVGKGNLFALKRFNKFTGKVSGNGKVLPNNYKDFNYIRGYCLKADIKHYFREVNHHILVNILKKKINDEKVILLVEKILKNGFAEKEMPLGNLTSQFFANVYLNELDYLVKHALKAKFYIRYVDDFVILHHSKKKLEEWRGQIDRFLGENLKIELHPEKSQIIPISKGIDFVGFRNFYHFRLLRKRNIRKMKHLINQFRQGITPKERILESFQGWNAYAKWADSYNLRRKLKNEIVS